MSNKGLAWSQASRYHFSTPYFQTIASEAPPQTDKLVELILPCLKQIPPEAGHRW
jgi:hypothetical protein